MALNSSGPISLAGTTAGVSIQVELGGTGTTQISLNDASVRTLAGVATGAITMPTNFYGKSNRLVVTVTISASTQNYLANTAKVTGYAAGTTDVTFVINSAVVVGSASVGSYAFTVDTSWAAGDTVTVINNGTVIGFGGTGGAGGTSSGGLAGNGFNGTSGGPAVSVGRAITWTNTSGVAGGGGGGGAGGGAADSFNGVGNDVAGGGGGGGGQGNSSSGGAGGAGYLGGTTSGSAGSAGSGSSGGNGGAGGTFTNLGGTPVGMTGGNGGALGSSGSLATGGATPDGIGVSGSVGAGGACLVGKSFVNSGAGITGGTTGGSQT